MAPSSTATERVGKLIKSLPERGIITLEKLERGGSLQARKLAGGVVQFYWRYSFDGSTYREPIGPFDPSAPPKKLAPTTRGYSVAAARERCRVLAEAHAQRSGTGGLREAKAEHRATYLARKVVEAQKAENTLSALLDVYIEHLEDAGAAKFV